MDMVYDGSRKADIRLSGFLITGYRVERKGKIYDR